MQTVTTLPVLQAVSDSTDHYLGLQPIIKGRTNAEYVNSNLRFNPSSNTLTLNANLNIRSGAIIGTALAANTVTGDKLGQSAISANNISNLAQPIGVNQTWTNVTSTRTTGVTYTNTAGRPIMVAVTPTAAGGLIGAFNINGSVVAGVQHTPSGGGGASAFSYIIPNGATYSVTNLGNFTILYWWELR
jgi:hypothetical protein